MSHHFDSPAAIQDSRLNLRDVYEARPRHQAVWGPQMPGLVLAGVSGRRPP